MTNAPMVRIRPPGLLTRLQHRTAQMLSGGGRIIGIVSVEARNEYGSVAQKFGEIPTRLDGGGKSSADE